MDYLPDQTSATMAQPLAPAKPARSRSRTIALILVAVLFFATASAGVVFAAQRLFNQTQAADSMLPADTIGLLNVDLSPSAQQRFNAWKISRQVSTATKGSLGNPEVDWRRGMWEEITRETGHRWDNVDYTRDIQPWLGDKATLALVPASDQPSSPGEPEAVFVLEITDKQQAEEGLARIQQSAERFGYTIGDNYALVAASQELVEQVITQGQQAPLADSPTYKRQMDSLGERGVFSGWVDLGRIQTAMSDNQGSDPDVPAVFPLSSMAGNLISADSQLADDNKLSGQIMLVTRFDENALEMVVRVEGVPQLKQPAKKAVASVNVPESSLVVASMAGWGDYLTQMWPDIEKTYGPLLNGGSQGFNLAEQIKQATGWQMPQDGQTLLGEQFTMAVDAPAPQQQGESELASSSLETNGIPPMGLQVTTDGNRFAQLVDTLYATAYDGERGLENIGGAIVTNPDTAVVATSDRYARQLLAGGTLAESQQFQHALPDAAQAQSLVYVDIDGLVGAYPQWLDNADPQVAQMLRDLDSLGITDRFVDEHTSEVKMRLTFN